MRGYLALGGLAAAGVAIAMAPTGVAAPGVIGPDVIVGDLHEVIHWGAFGGIDAYSVGTFSCNVGDEVLLWDADTNLHPVIGQNMFRLANGRFEQVGQSWLKHGFAALTLDLCSSCNDPNDSQLLGVGCADPYGASLNGAQGLLGPKSEVNANTGFFIYPHAGPSGNSTTRGRLQVPTADMEPASNPGAVYVVEGHYVTPDDHAAGNAYNNASWRQVWVAGNRDISFNNPNGGNSSTQREEAAIEAWGQFESGVGTTNSFDPDGGIFYVAWKPVDIGGGQWHYEFAVQNLSSDRSMGAFEVFLPGGGSSSNHEFSDVDYHSGEPYSNADWALNANALSVEWSTDDFNSNANANACRWGTLYNFAMDSDVQLVPGDTVRVHLFKPGSGSFIDVTLPEPGIIIIDNDDCAGADPIGTGTTAFDTTGSTTDGIAMPDDGSPEQGDCTDFGDPQVNNDIWFEYTADCTGPLRLFTCNQAQYDTKIAIYDGCVTCPPPNTDLMGCNDDSGGCADFSSDLTVNVVQGNCYKVRVGGFGAGDQGTGSLTLECDGVVEDNDLCSSTTPIAEGATAFDTTGSATDGIAVDGSGAPEEGDCNDFGDPQVYNDIWFEYIPICTGTAHLFTCDQAGYDTKIAVYDGCGTCPPSNAQLIGCNDDGVGCGGFTSDLMVGVNAGNCYKVRVGGFGAGDAGTGTLTIMCEGPKIVDCNGNGVDDSIDIAKGTSEDCNGNNIPDECDIADGAPDGAGGPIGDLAAGTTLWDSLCINCHGNNGEGGVGPDIRDYSRVQLWNELADAGGDHPGGQHPRYTQQDYANLEWFLITTGTSGARPDMIPDECQKNLPDCDGDGTADECELADGTQIDANLDGIPDDCQQAPCPWDLNGDGDVGPADLAQVLDNWGPNPGHPADFNGDGDVGPADLAQVLDNWGACP